MLKKLSFFFFIPVIIASGSLSELVAEEANIPIPRLKEYPWMSLEKWKWFYQGDLDRAQAGPVDVLFLGDSITECWDTEGLDVWNQFYEPLRGANFGVGGDTTQNVLWRITEGGSLDGISPGVVVLMIGTNNLGLKGDPPAKVAKGVTAIIDVLTSRLPDAEILLLSVFPRGKTPEDELRKEVIATNQLIKPLSQRKNVTWLELWDVFLAEDGSISPEIMPDALHPTETGYRIWAREMAPTLEKLLSKATPK